MISSWVFYAIGVALALGVAALLVEHLLLGAGRPTRWVWLAALVGSVAVPVLAPWLGSLTWGGGAAGVAVELGRIHVLDTAPAAPLPWWERALGAVWLLGSAGLLAACLFAMALLARQRRGWRLRPVAGTAALVSRSTGPAVVGFLWPEVVIPGWVLDWDEPAQRLLLEHEREHERAGDQYLLLVAVGALILFPWNLALWWQTRRLRLAIEVDCDARVLRRRPDPRAYGLLLLEVGLLSTRSRVPAAAFAGSKSSLERRIRILAHATPRPRRLARLAGWAGVLLVPAAVYALPAPAHPDLGRALAAPRLAEAPSPRPLPSDTPPGELGKAPASTPSAPKPELLSRSEAAEPEAESSAAPGTERVPVWRSGGHAAPAETPYTEHPKLLNRDEFAQLLEQSYPPQLRSAGAGGTVVAWVHIDERGQVTETRLISGSGHEALDRVAQQVLRGARFAPARDEGRPVEAWIRLPVTFRARVAN